MKRFSVYFWIRKNVIYCNILHESKKCTDFSTGLKCDPENFNPKTQKSNQAHINRELDRIVNQIFDIKYDFDSRKEAYNADIIKRVYFNKTLEPKKVLELYSEFINYKKSQGKNTGTIRTYTNKEARLREYLVFIKKEKLYINEINLNFIEAFQSYLLKKGNDTSYINRQIQTIIALLSFAERKQYIQNNHLRSFEYLPKQPKPKIYLTTSELEVFEKGKITSLALQRVRDLFLFQCYTGMDYSTMKNFRESQIKTFQGQLFIEGDRQKNQQRFIVPLSDQALAIWNKYYKSLPIISNAKYNMYLKNICEILDIKKQLTTHSGRKTFANVWESKGLDRRTIADMLGHTKVDMTLKHYSDVQFEGILSRLSMVA